MKRIKMEVVFHVADSADERVFADRLLLHMSSFRNPDRSRSEHHINERCEISVEQRTWEKTT